MPPCSRSETPAGDGEAKAPEMAVAASREHSPFLTLDISASFLPGSLGVTQKALVTQDGAQLLDAATWEAGLTAYEEFRLFDGGREVPIDSALMSQVWSWMRESLRPLRGTPVETASGQRVLFEELDIEDRLEVTEHLARKSRAGWRGYAAMQILFLLDNALILAQLGRDWEYAAAARAKAASLAASEKASSRASSRRLKNVRDLAIADAKQKCYEFWREWQDDTALYKNKRVFIEKFLEVYGDVVKNPETVRRWIHDEWEGRES